MIPGTRTWRALGTSVHVLTTEAHEVEAAATSVSTLLHQVDIAYSRFRADSELSALARRPGQWVRVSPLLAEAIAASLRAARLTDGAVDPTIGRSMRLVGYDDDFIAVAGRSGPIELRIAPVPGWQVIRFDPTARVALLPEGVELDLGSTGKALAADLAAVAAAMAVRTGGVLVSLGGDVSTAGDPPSGGWRILAAETSDATPDGDGEVVAIDGGALATSSTTVRRWTRGDVTLHHILDPATGLPAAGPWRTATVVADTCVDANAAATAAIVKGWSAFDWLEKLGLPARLVSTTGDVLRTSRWPAALTARAAR